VPVVDVERTGRSSAELQRELLIFLKALEDHYGVKPIIYASSKFRKRHLDNPAFDSYPFWVAHYYVVRPETTKPWVLWQFTDHASVEGIGEYTDLNVFRGSEADFQSLRIK
jgi:lysozyme